jgi:dTDP-4-dehydrorhamnose reductase
MKLKIWITGASGMLGKDLTSLAKAQGHECLLTDLDVDITDEKAVTLFLENNKPDCIVNCAAYTAVDLAETETALNYKVNAIGPQVLGKCAAQKKVPLLHISTDYVLNGNPPAPLNPEDEYHPVNAYGKAKMEGERFLLESGASVWIIRTAWLYGINGKNFVKTMLSLMNTKEKLSVVNDQFGNPTWTVDLARAILTVLQSGSHFGIYHFTGEGITTWCDFALKIQELGLQEGLLSKKIPIEGVLSSQFKTAAVRPSWSALSKEKIKSTFSIQVPKWEDSLASYIQLEKEHAGK